MITLLFFSLQFIIVLFQQFSNIFYLIQKTWLVQLGKRKRLFHRKIVNNMLDFCLHFCALGALFNYFAMFVFETVFINKLSLMDGI